MNYYLWFPVILTVYAFISTYGLYLIKAADSIMTMDFMVGFFFYGSGFLIWMYILRLYPLSTAFPIAAGALIVATQIAGIFFLKEETNMAAIVGTGMIIFGIILIYSTMSTSNS